MVSGAAVVSAEAIWNRVLQQNDNVLALDMEAYGVALATQCATTPQYNPSWFIAKSVCDYGARKEDHAQPYAAYTSVRFFKLYLDEFILGTEPRRAPARTNILSSE
jgi:nucleoside phosphorylase